MLMEWTKRLFLKWGKCSPVEAEVRRRLTWRVMICAAMPVPLLLLLLFYLYCCMQIEKWSEIESVRASVRSLQRQNRAIDERLRIIEQRLEMDRDAKRGDL